LWKKLDKHDWPRPFLEGILDECWEDTAGYAAAEMVRRVAGMTPVSDLEDVANVALRREMDCDLITMATELLRNPGAGPERILEITQL
jgi:5-methylthioribose kinase